MVPHLHSRFLQISGMRLTVLKKSFVYSYQDMGKKNHMTMNNDDLTVFYRPYHAFWWSGDVRDQCINRCDIELVVLPARCAERKNGVSCDELTSLFSRTWFSRWELEIYFWKGRPGYHRCQLDSWTQTHVGNDTNQDSFKFTKLNVVRMRCSVLIKENAVVLNPSLNLYNVLLSVCVLFIL